MSENVEMNENELENAANAMSQEKDSKREEIKSGVVPIKWFTKFEDELQDQSKKIVVITGTTSGTGMIAVKTSLKKGATVVCLNRNSEKAKTALSTFFEEFEETVEKCSFVTCDLQDFESVTNAALEVSKLLEETGFDILVNNAGIMALEDKATKDGYDIQMQTNHLSHFLLTKLLFPLLKKRAEEYGEARVVNHTSFLRLWPAIPLKAKYFGKHGGNLGGNGTSQAHGGRWKRYHQTKLANSVFTLELQKKIKKSKLNILSLCAHPGIASTSLHSTAQQGGGVKNTNYEKSGQSQEDGTMGLLKCMFHTDVKPGALYGPKRLKGPARKLLHGILSSSSAGKLLWRESEKACGEFQM